MLKKHNPWNFEWLTLHYKLIIFFILLTTMERQVKTRYRQTSLVKRPPIVYGYIVDRVLCVFWQFFPEQNKRGFLLWHIRFRKIKQQENSQDVWSSLSRTRIGGTKEKLVTKPQVSPFQGWHFKLALGNLVLSTELLVTMNIWKSYMWMSCKCHHKVFSPKADVSSVTE